MGFLLLGIGYLLIYEVLEFFLTNRRFLGLEMGVSMGTGGLILILGTRLVFFNRRGSFSHLI